MRRPLWALALGLAGASFALDLYLSANDPVADFYLVFSRIWELLLGGTLALVAPRLPSSGRAASSRPRGDRRGARRREPVVDRRPASLSGLARSWADARRRPPHRGGPASLRQFVAIVAPPDDCARQDFLPSLSLALALAGVRAHTRGRRLRAAVALGAHRGRDRHGASDLCLHRKAHPVRRLRHPAIGDHGGDGRARPRRIPGLPCWRPLLDPIHAGDGRPRRRYRAGRISRVHGLAFAALRSKIGVRVRDRDRGVLLCAQSIANTPPRIMFVGDSHAKNHFLGWPKGFPGVNVGDHVRDPVPALLRRPALHVRLSGALAAEPGVRTIRNSAFRADALATWPKTRASASS